jgi:hypothetical protein
MRYSRVRIDGALFTEPLDNYLTAKGHLLAHSGISPERISVQLHPTLLPGTCELGDWLLSHVGGLMRARASLKWIALTLAGLGCQEATQPNTVELARARQTTSGLR